MTKFISIFAAFGAASAIQSFGAPHVEFDEIAITIGELSEKIEHKKSRLNKNRKRLARCHGEEPASNEGEEPKKIERRDCPICYEAPVSRELSFGDCLLTISKALGPAEKDDLQGIVDKARKDKKFESYHNWGSLLKESVAADADQAMKNICHKDYGATVEDLFKAASDHEQDLIGLLEEEPFKEFVKSLGEDAKDFAFKVTAQDRAKMFFPKRCQCLDWYHESCGHKVDQCPSCRNNIPTTEDWISCEEIEAQKEADEDALVDLREHFIQKSFELVNEGKKLRKLVKIGEHP